MTEPSIRAVRAFKWYGRVGALSEVTLHLEPGIWGLLGPNGSGKTTLLRLFSGQTRPSLGEVRVCGESPFRNPRILRRIGLCPEADALYDELSALEFISVMAQWSGVPRAEAGDRATSILQRFGLEDVRHRRLATYSRGMRQRVKIAQALVHDPDVILMDEPLMGTDPISRQSILDELRLRAAGGALIVVSSHVLHELDALTDRVLLVARGSVVAQGQTEQIRDLLTEYPRRIQIACDRARDLARVLAGEDSISGLRFVGPKVLEVESASPDATYDAVSHALLGGNFGFHSLTSPDASLEAVFHYLLARMDQKHLPPDAHARKESA